jgi:SAM-dependent methyltransferase
VNCRHCGAPLRCAFLDLGFAPPSNAYLSPSQLNLPEVYFPLRLRVCDACWLVQTEDYARADELFGPDYAYFSSTSPSWLAHAARYVNEIVRLLRLGAASHVIEIGANDGYLLRNFVTKGISCLGIEPTDSTVAAAEALGIPVLREFFSEAVGARLADEGKAADLIVGNNVYAHVPDINDFTRGLKRALKLGGTITLEFPHLQQLMAGAQFDTVYHEHFSYLSLYTVSLIFRRAALRIIDAVELTTHGGSLRIFGCHEDDPRAVSRSVRTLLEEERAWGLRNRATYETFQSRVDKIKDDLLDFLISAKREGRSVAAYGAAAKGNTLLNYAGVKPDMVQYVCDAAAAKQGKYMPGSHIPIVPPSVLSSKRPDYLVILPWNLEGEVRQQNSVLVETGTTFVTAVPELRMS